MIQVTDATVLVNNEAIGIVPNSLKFTEGFGERKKRTVSVGDGKTEQIYARDNETRKGRVMFELPTTIDNIALARAWAANDDRNVVQIAGQTVDGELTRTYTQAAVINDYEVEVGTETNISIEIEANAPI